MTCRLPDKKLATIGFGLTLRFLIALIAALALAGCPPNDDDTSSPPPANQDLKALFHVNTASEAFARLHTLINDNTADFTAKIHIGDYIDLDSLTIGSATINDAPITANKLPFYGYKGRLLRLIVVGINSFKPGATGADGPANNPSAPNHVVFQFQNAPFLHNMNDLVDTDSDGTPDRDTNIGGYAGSEMKTYLMDDFLPVLKTATGLTDEMLWAPVRKVSHGGFPLTATDTIEDKLWLPTEWEMFGVYRYSTRPYDVVAGQARLEYYANDARRIKFEAPNIIASYWLASPIYANAERFLFIQFLGKISSTSASFVTGCAPAFCVK